MTIEPPITIKVLKIQFPNYDLAPFDIPKFRGAVAHQFSGYELIHNHLTNGKLRYKYPLIQFKVINRTPTIIGLKEGIPVLYEVFMTISEMEIAQQKHTIWEKSLLMAEEPIGQTQDWHRYRFLSPWMALKEENYDTYRQLDPIEAQVFLRHLLRENLKTITKGLGYWITDIDQVQVEGFFHPLNRNFKNNRMICFTGEFTVNFRIPDYLGIGKQVARGFGTIERTK